MPAQIVDAPAHSVLTWNADGSYTCAPKANYNGSFTCKVNDGKLDSSAATVSLAVGAVNDAPQGMSNTVTTLEDAAYAFQLGCERCRPQRRANNFSVVTIGS